MKFLFACILIALALFAIAKQQGAIQPITDNLKSGKIEATIRGM